MNPKKYIIFFFIVTLFIILDSCELAPVSIAQRLEYFQDDLNKAPVPRSATNFQEHFHSTMVNYGGIAGPAGHAFFHNANFPNGDIAIDPADWRNFDIVPDGAATNQGAGVMRQRANVFRNNGAGANSLSVNTYFDMKQESGEDWYIIQYVADGALVIN